MMFYVMDQEFILRSIKYESFLYGILKTVQLNPSGQHETRT